MITLENRFFPLRSAACILIEGGIIIVSVIVSITILEKASFTDGVTLNDALQQGILIAIFCQTCMYFLDLYDLKYSLSAGELFFSILFSIGFVCIGIGVLSFAVPELTFGGRVYYLTILFLAVVLFVWRSVYDFILDKVAPKHNIAVIGTGSIASLVAREISTRERLGFRFAGFIGPQQVEGRQVGEKDTVLCGYESIEGISSRDNVKTFVVAINERRGEYPIKELLALKVKGYRIIEWAPFFEKLSGRVLIDSLAPSFFIFSEGFRKTRFSRAIRRINSFVLAAMACILLSPFFLFVPILIRLDSPGPIFYLQERVGRNGKRFLLVKFRSMVRDAENEYGPRWATENDPRVTTVGRWIRKFRVDEFPQLINILKGDLDLVGPRPERPVFVEQLQQMFPYYSLRHTIQPGVTGWAQVMFPYCGTIDESKEKLQYDLFYVKNMSLKLDVLIIFRTVKIVLLGRGAR